ncbi:MAG: hypothetical protein ACOX4L_03755 [Bacillota bacterium]
MQINRWLAGSLVILLTIFSLIGQETARADTNPNTTAKLPEIVKGMSLEEKVGQMFMPDFRQWDGKNVTEINEEIVQAIQQHHLGGVILFRENLVDTGTSCTAGGSTAAELPVRSLY